MWFPQKGKEEKIVTLHTVLFQSSKLSSGLCTNKKKGGGRGCACCNKCQRAKKKKNVPRAPLSLHTGDTCHTHFTHTLLTLATYSGNQQHVLQSHNRGPQFSILFSRSCPPFEVLPAAEVLSTREVESQSAAARYSIHYGQSATTRSDATSRHDTGEYLGRKSTGRLSQRHPTFSSS